jgi:hypothetical protein
MTQNARAVIHQFHDDTDSLVTGSRVAQRMNEVAAEQGVEIEVFCFGPAQRVLGSAGDAADESHALFNRRIDELIAAGVRVTACVNAAREAGNDEELQARGLELRVARDEFLRYTLEGATVLTF